MTQLVTARLASGGCLQANGFSLLHVSGWKVSNISDGYKGDISQTHYYVNLLKRGMEVAVRIQTGRSHKGVICLPLTSCCGFGPHSGLWAAGPLAAPHTGQAPLLLQPGSLLGPCLRRALLK